MYSCWARCRACTRVWPRYQGKKQIPRCPRDDTQALAAIALAGLKTRRYDGESRSLIALGMTPGARGRRVGGSEDPPLQLKGAEVGMVGAAGNAAVAAVDKHE